MSNDAVGDIMQRILSLTEAQLADLEGRIDQWSREKFRCEMMRTEAEQPMPRELNMDLPLSLPAGTKA